MVMSKLVRTVLIFSMIFHSFCTSERRVAVPVKKGVVIGELGKKIDMYLTRIVPYGFSGTALVAEGEDIILDKGYGFAIESQAIPNTADTVLSTGSITKQFTAAAILKLEMQGKIRTDDLITKYFDDVPEAKAGITIHNLLTHTAGLIGYTGSEPLGDFEAAERDETIRKVFQEPLLFLPGKDMRYSNAGYSVLAAIIEKASGHTYEEYLREHLFKPAGMHSTGYRLPDWDKQTVAHYYEDNLDFGTFLHQPYPYWHLLGNGGLLSTTGDMFRWHIALEGEDILSSAAKEKLYTPFLNNYAYGWNVTESDQGTLIQHKGGGSFTDSADYLRFVDAGVVISAFCNREYNHLPLAEYITPKIAAIVFGRSIEFPPKVMTERNLDHEKFEGIYRISSQAGINIQAEEKFLRIQPYGQEAINTLIKPFLEKNQDLNILNKCTLKVVKSLFIEDHKSIIKALGEKDLNPRLLKYLNTAIPSFKNRIGTIRNIKVLGTIPKVAGSYGEKHSFATGISIEGKNRTFIFQVIWKKGRLVDLLRRDDETFFEIPFFHLSENEFSGYHLFLARSLSLDFQQDKEGKMAGLILEDNIGSKYFQRQ